MRAHEICVEISLDIAWKMCPRPFQCPRFMDLKKHEALNSANQMTRSYWSRTNSFRGRDGFDGMDAYIVIIGGHVLTFRSMLAVTAHFYHVLTELMGDRISQLLSLWTLADTLQPAGVCSSSKALLPSPDSAGHLLWHRHHWSLCSPLLRKGSQQGLGCAARVLELGAANQSIIRGEPLSQCGGARMAMVWAFLHQLSARWLEWTSSKKISRTDLWQSEENRRGGWARCGPWVAVNHQNWMAGQTDTPLIGDINK